MDTTSVSKAPAPEQASQAPRTVPLDDVMMERLEALALLVTETDDMAYLVGTTGILSRESPVRDDARLSLGLIRAAAARSREAADALLKDAMDERRAARQAAAS